MEARCRMGAGHCVAALRRLLVLAYVSAAVGLPAVTWAQSAKSVSSSAVPLANGAAVVSPSAATDLHAWLRKVHEASRARAYSGTFVVSTGSSISSSRIWHVCDGVQQIERIESLTGPARSTFRRNDQVVTFYPESRRAVIEKRDALGVFPSLLQHADSRIDRYYELKRLGIDRVVGREAEVVQLQPRDAMRFGYRIWTDRKTGLLLRLQTIDVQGRVLEQAAFSELQLDALVDMKKLDAMMSSTDGYRLERPQAVAIDPDSSGWRVVGAQTHGFRPAGCFQRMPSEVASLANAQDASPAGTPLQWIFTDGLAHVSVFISAFDPRRHTREMAMELGGATHSVSRRMGEWWLTAVGEVPASTLVSLTSALERSR